MFRVVTIVVSVHLALASGALASGGDPVVERGMKIYADQKCSLCHSIGDKGNKKGPLEGVGSKYTREEIRTWIVSPKVMEEKTGATRKPAMKGYPDLPAEELEALVAYMVSLKKQ
jgi:mono/diheme cytochrome c family protein